MKLTALALTLSSALIATNLYAATCPTGAICRSTTPGKYSTKGSFATSKYTMPVGSTPGGATVYYPTSGATAPYSVLVFTPPYTGTQSMFADWGPFFASYGIVLVTMDTATTADSVDQRASQQKTVLDKMKAENTRTGSPLKGKIATTRVGAMGWSMGGGATWINSAEYSGLKSAMTLAGHNDTSLNINSKGYNTKCPTMMFNGVLDQTILGGYLQSEGVYAAIPSGVPKAYYNVASAGHFSWGSPTAANKYVAEMALAFQKTYLDGDTRWAPFIARPLLDVYSYQEANIPNN